MSDHDGVGTAVEAEESVKLTKEETETIIGRTGDENVGTFTARSPSTSDISRGLASRLGVVGQQEGAGMCWEFPRDALRITVRRRR